MARCRKKNETGEPVTKFTMIISSLISQDNMKYILIRIKYLNLQKDIYINVKYHKNSRFRTNCVDEWLLPCVKNAHVPLRLAWNIVQKISGPIKR